MIPQVFVVTEIPAPLASMAFPPPETNWHALHGQGFVHVVRLHPADYDPAPLLAHDVVLEDLYGGAEPQDPAAERRRIWEAAALVAELVSRGEGVVVHCVGGTGRTGTVLACALRRLGRSADDAIATVRQYRPHWPESPAQEQVVHSEPELR
jgi:Polymorphic toxin system, DSP-PTPase phosphatase